MRLTRIGLWAALLATVAVASSIPAAAQTLLIDRIVVRVNDRIATMTDFNKQLADRRQAILADRSLEESRRQQLLQSAGRDVLTEMYQDLLLLSRSDQIGAKVTENDVERAITQMRERMGLATEDALRQALAGAGLSEDAWRDRMRRNLLVQEVIGREVQPRLKVTEEEQRRFYRDHPAEFTQPAALRLQEIVVLEEGRVPQTVAATAAALHAELVAGKTFEEVAKQGVAAGTTTAVIDLGWVSTGDLDPALERAAGDLAPDAFTAPVPGRGGLHIVKLLERRPASVRPFDEVKDRIVAFLEQQQMGKEYNAYLRELEERSYIALRVPPEAEGFVGIEREVAPPSPDEAAPGAAPAAPSGA